MSEVVEAKQNSIDKLSDLMAQMPQFEEGAQTEHLFAGGMYMRKVSRVKGVTIVGKVHRKEHFCIIAKGKIAIAGPDGKSTIYEAGDVIVSKPGTQRVTHALEDSVLITVHRTDKKNLEKIEKELIEPFKYDYFDFNNKLKDPLLKHSQEQRKQMLESECQP